jgi:hypothetical protein
LYTGKRQVPALLPISFNKTLDERSGEFVVVQEVQEVQERPNKTYNLVLDETTGNFVSHRVMEEDDSNNNQNIEDKNGGNESFMNQQDGDEDAAEARITTTQNKECVVMLTPLKSPKDNDGSDDDGSDPDEPFEKREEDKEKTCPVNDDDDVVVVQHTGPSSEFIVLGATGPHVLRRSTRVRTAVKKELPGEERRPIVTRVTRSAASQPLPSVKEEEEVEEGPNPKKAKVYKNRLARKARPPIPAHLDRDGDEFDDDHERFAESVEYRKTSTAVKRTVQSEVVENDMRQINIDLIEELRSVQKNCASMKIELQKAVAKLDGTYKTVLDKWEVGSMADYEKYKRRVRIQDVIDSGLSVGNYDDPFVWIDEWDEPYIWEDKSSTYLKYRDTFAVPRPNKHYDDDPDIQIGDLITEFKNTPVS